MNQTSVQTHLFLLTMVSRRRKCGIESKGPSHAAALAVSRPRELLKIRPGLAVFVMNGDLLNLLQIDV